MAKSPKPDAGYREIPGNKYEKDAHYLCYMVRSAYPRLSDKLSPARYEAAEKELIQKCKKLPDDRAFNLEIQRFLAKLRDGHTKASVVRYHEKGAPLYSLRFFNEGGRFLLLNLPRNADSALIGSRIKSVNGIGMDSVKWRIRSLESSENEYFALHRFAGKESFPEYWKALGIIRHDTDSLLLELETPGKTGAKVVLTPGPLQAMYQLRFGKPKHPFTSRQNDGFYYKILENEKTAYLQMNTCLDYVAYKSEIRNYTNVFLRLPALAVLKKRSKNARDFGKTLQAMFREMQEKNVQTLVLDLRNNTGGDERLGKQLIWYLTERRDLRGFREFYRISPFFRSLAKVDYRKFSRLYREKYQRPLPMDTLLNVTEALYANSGYFDGIETEDSPFFLDQSLPKFKGRVYVIIGPKTFSAAQWLATTLQDNGLATVVGQPLGNQPSCQTGASLLKLPHTKTLLTLSYLYAERPDSSKNAEDTLFPDAEVIRTLSGALSGRDEAFEWILEENKRLDTLKQ